MPSHRKERVASLLQQELSRILREDVKDPRIGPWITITRVRMSDDLRYATAFWTVLGGDPQRRADVEAGLSRSLGFIRGRVGQAVRMRFTPEVSFRHDDTFDDALRVARLLEEVSEERERSAPEEPEADEDAE